MTATEAAATATVFPGKPAPEAESPLHRAGHIGDEVGAEHPEWVANYAEPFTAPVLEPWDLPDHLCRPFLFLFDEAAEPTEPFAPATEGNSRTWLDRLPAQVGTSPGGAAPWLYEGELIAWERAQASEGQRSHGPMAIAQGPPVADEPGAPRFVPAADDTSVDLPAIGELDEHATEVLDRFNVSHDEQAGPRHA